MLTLLIILIIFAPVWQNLVFRKQVNILLTQDKNECIIQVRFYFWAFPITYYYHRSSYWIHNITPDNLQNRINQEMLVYFPLWDYNFTRYLLTSSGHPTPSTVLFLKRWLGGNIIDRLKIMREAKNTILHNSIKL